MTLSVGVCGAGEDVGRLGAELKESEGLRALEEGRVKELTARVRLLQDQLEGTCQKLKDAQATAPLALAEHRTQC